VNDCVLLVVLLLLVRGFLIGRAEDDDVNAAAATNRLLLADLLERRGRTEVGDDLDAMIVGWKILMSDQCHTVSRNQQRNEAPIMTV